jgi:hypothetical protein
MSTTTPPNTTWPLPQSTPIKADSSTVLPFTTHNKYRIETCTAMAAEIKKYLVGPMPVQEFLHSFFPIEDHNLAQNFERGHYDDVVNVKLENHAYNPFVSLKSQLMERLLDNCFF